MAIPGVSGNRVFLSEEITPHIASFLSPEKTATSIQHRIFNSGEETVPVFPLGEVPRRGVIENTYQKVLGQTARMPLDEEEMLRCIRRNDSKQPDARVNHSAYSAPGNCLERWKWIVGVENSLDRQVQQKYETVVRSIEQQPTASILQLKNKMVAFWHADREVVDYIQFCSEEKALATSGMMNKIFFSCLGFLFKLYYKPSSDLTRLTVELDRRSASTFATIGEFQLGNQEYDVVACHPLGDHRHAQQEENDDETHRAFHSKSSGKTYVGIFEKGDNNRRLRRFGYHGDRHNCQVQIARDAVDPSFHKYHYEACTEHRTAAVYGNRRHLFVGNDIAYRDGTRNAEGSDRELDRKLTQIMIEIAHQNNVTSLQVTSNRSDFAVLAASGFNSCGFSRGAGNMLQELDRFRAAQQSNKLFPPYEDYATIRTEFKMDGFNAPNVSYSREEVKSWSEIVEEEPILREGAAILPEYWAVKPNIFVGS